MAKVIKVFKDVLQKNEKQAELNRMMLKKYGTFAVNIMGSPGAGKTTLIEFLIEVLLKDSLKVGVLEGDYTGSIDAEYLSSKFNIPIVQLDVESCHLNASFVATGLKNLPLERIDILFIENVGNLICPAEFEIGDFFKMLVYSVPEGDDKPLKYPLMFKKVDAVVLSKFDLRDKVDFDLKKAEKLIKKLNPSAKVFRFSKKEPDSIVPLKETIKEAFKIFKNVS